MEELVRFVAQALVEEPDKVNVYRKETRRTTILKLRVAPGDTGRVIGKGGRVANAIRAVVNVPLATMTVLLSWKSTKTAQKRLRRKRVSLVSLRSICLRQRKERFRCLYF